MTNSFEAARGTYKKIADNIAKIMRGQSGSTRYLLAALASAIMAVVVFPLAVQALRGRPIRKQPPTVPRV